MITLSDYFMGRDKQYAQDLTPEILANAEQTVARVNLLLSRYKSATGDAKIRKVTSGWRPPAVNQGVSGAAPRSKHMTGEAVDIADPDGKLDEWCLENPKVLEEVGCWQEHPSATAVWCHLQIVPPKSGRRVFYP